MNTCIKSCLLALIVCVLVTRGQAAPEPDLRNVMKAKLAHLQSILEGLALEDFDRIKKGAQTLGALSRADAWNIHKSPEYVKFSKDFQDLADAMAADAGAKKLEAVTLDYVQMTMLCVKCHTWTRKQGVAKSDGPDFSLARIGATK
jgi:hypothetical protein